MIKAYTDLEQSKKLAEILPIESADMYWKNGVSDKYIQCFTPFVSDEYGTNVDFDYDVPCWSLTALLDIIPYNVTFNKAVYRFELVKFTDHWECYHENFGAVSTDIFKADNPVDSCYEMILKLHKQKLL